MDPILRIVKYLFKKQDICIPEETITSFFVNGRNFPRFIELIYHERIPEITRDPMGLERSDNNKKALAFLFEKNPLFAELIPSLETETDQINLLSLILSNLCFKINEKEIFDECNLLFSLSGDPYILIQKVPDLQNIKCMLHLLSIVTGNKVNKDPETDDFDQIIHNISEKTGVPIVIDKTSFEIGNSFIFLIQILIFFDYFSTTINKMKKRDDFGKDNSEEESSSSFNEDEFELYPFNNDDEENEKEEKQRKKHEEEEEEEDSSEIYITEEDEEDKSEKISQFNQRKEMEKKEDRENKSEKQEENKNEKQEENKSEKEEENKNEKEEENKNEKEEEEEEEEQIKEESTKDYSSNEEDYDNDYVDDQKEEEKISKIIKFIDDLKDNDSQSVKNNEEEEYFDEKEQKKNDKNFKFLNIYTILELGENSIRIIKESLLNTINSIEPTKIHFDNILESIEINKIVNLLQIFFNEREDISFLFSLKRRKSADSEKLKDIIEFLSKKIPVFKVLQFNFNDDNLKEPSAILLYMKLLDFFLLKQKKSEMLDICQNLLFKHIEKDDTLYQLSLKIKKNPKQRKEILHNWNTYLALVYYANEKNIHFQIEKLTPEEYSFKKKQIPQIINEEYLDQIKFDLSPLYYQLQFIFNELEKDNLITDSNSLSKDEDTINNENDDSDKSEENKILELMTTVKNNKIIVEYIQTHEPNYAMPEKKPNKETISTFRYRLLINSLQLSRTIQNKKDGSLTKAVIFWNKNYDISLYKNGLFDCMQENEPEIWDDAIRNINFKKINQKDATNKKIIKFMKYTPFEKAFELYKFFIYNEEKKKWEVNSDVISSFMIKMNIYSKQTTTPLVLCFNSYEKHFKLLNSNLIDESYPNLKDEDSLDQIFVYALYGRRIDIENKKYKNPIYLLLNVPSSKKELKNLNCIIHQIYYFLSIICDAEIVLLNSEHYKDQLYLLEKYNKILLSYKESLKQQKYTQSPKTTDHSDTNDEQLSSDGDEDIDENDDAIADDFDNEIVSANHLEIFEKKPNYIILINSNELEDSTRINKYIDQNNFFNELGKNLTDCNCYFNFINTNEKSTYFDFLKTLYNVSFSCNTYTNKETFERLKFIELANMSSYYIQYKLGIQLMSLEDMIIKRFDQFKQYNTSFKSDLYLLTQLNNELIKTYPPIDIEYNKVCNSAISKIKDKKTKKYQQVIVNELKKSSESSIDFWDKQIQTKNYWSNEDRNNIRYNHEMFLKSEYFDIISEIYHSKEVPHIFKGNYSVLKEKIDDDNDKLKKIFKKFDIKIRSADIQKDDQQNTEDFDIQQNVEDIDDLKMKGTNYMIREKENVREKKVIVDTESKTENFDSIFESDF